MGKDKEIETAEEVGSEVVPVEEPTPSVGAFTVDEKLTFLLVMNAMMVVLLGLVLAKVYL